MTPFEGDQRELGEAINLIAISSFRATKSEGTPTPTVEKPHLQKSDLKQWVHGRRAMFD